MTLPTILQGIQQQQLANGGFPYFPGEEARPDATAWAVLGLSSYNGVTESTTRGRELLASLQLKNGQIGISPDHPEAAWPTPLVSLAWHGDPAFREAQERAIRFLLDFTGNHFSNPDPSIVGHDTTIRGWPWIAKTHSWVIPTALALMALHATGQSDHERVAEGQNMLLNRQLPKGGWNYGSTLVFGRPTSPLPESTAIALQALAGHIPQQKVQRSLEYLVDELPRFKTPLSLGWSLLALSAWDLRPNHVDDLVLESFQLQDRYGTYPLPSLALLACASQASEGLVSFLQSQQSFTHTATIHP